MLILPNEWILDYLTPGTNKPRLSEQLIVECRKRGDLLLIRRVSAFRSKIFRYSRIYRSDTQIGKFVNLVVRDSQLVQLVEETQIIPSGLDLATIPRDDHYLVEVLNSFPSAVLITTDQFLQEQIILLGLRAVLFRDDVEAALAAVDAFEKT